MEQEQRFGLSFQQWDYTVLKKGVEGLEDATNNLGFEQIFPDGNLYALLEALSYFWKNNDKVLKNFKFFTQLQLYFL